MKAGDLFLMNLRLKELDKLANIKIDKAIELFKFCKHTSDLILEMPHYTKYLIDNKN